MTAEHGDPVLVRVRGRRSKRQPAAGGVDGGRWPRVIPCPRVEPELLERAQRRPEIELTGARCIGEVDGVDLPVLHEDLAFADAQLLIPEEAIVRLHLPEGELRLNEAPGVPDVRPHVIPRPEVFEGEVSAEGEVVPAQVELDASAAEEGVIEHALADVVGVGVRQPGRPRVHLVRVNQPWAPRLRREHAKLLDLILRFIQRELEGGGVDVRVRQDRLEDGQVVGAIMKRDGVLVSVQVGDPLGEASEGRGAEVGLLAEIPTERRVMAKAGDHLPVEELALRA